MEMRSFGFSTLLISSTPLFTKTFEDLGRENLVLILGQRRKNQFDLFPRFAHFRRVTLVGHSGENGMFKRKIRSFAMPLTLGEISEHSEFGDFEPKPFATSRCIRKRFFPGTHVNEYLSHDIPCLRLRDPKRPNIREQREYRLPSPLLLVEYRLAAKFIRRR